MENTLNAMALDWSRIETVLLDMDGTVLDLAFDNFFWLHHLPARWGASRGLDAEAALQALMPHFIEHRGHLRWYCLDHWSGILDLDVAAEKRACRDRIAPLDGAEGFLRAVRESGRRALLVTNAHPDALDIKLAEVPLQVYFEAMVTSHELGLPKEDADFWPAFAQRYAVDLSRSLFIDDSEAVLRGARAGGVGQICGILAPDSTTPARAPFGDWPHVMGLRELRVEVL